MNVIRCGVASVFFWALLPLDRPLSSYGQVLPHEWGYLSLSAVLGVVIGDTLYLGAIKQIGVSRAMALAGIHPLTTLFFEWLLLRSPVSWIFFVGSSLVVMGVMCLSYRAQRMPETPDRRPVRFTFGTLLALSAAQIWGLSTVILKPALAHLSPVQANSLRMPFVGIILYSIWSWSGRKAGLRQMDKRSFLIVAGTGILGMGGLLAVPNLRIPSWAGQNRHPGFGLAGLRHGDGCVFSERASVYRVGPAKTATLVSASPVFGTVMAVFFLKEPLTLRLVLGVGLCVAGVWLVS